MGAAGRRQRTVRVDGSFHVLVRVDINCGALRVLAGAPRVAAYIVDRELLGAVEDLLKDGLIDGSQRSVYLQVSLGGHLGAVGLQMPYRNHDLDHVSLSLSCGLVLAVACAVNVGHLLSLGLRQTGDSGCGGGGRTGGGRQVSGAVNRCNRRLIRLEGGAEAVCHDQRLLTGGGAGRGQNGGVRAGIGDAVDDRMIDHGNDRLHCVIADHAYIGVILDAGITGDLGCFDIGSGEDVVEYGAHFFAADLGIRIKVAVGAAFYNAEQVSCGDIGVRAVLERLFARNIDSLAADSLVGVQRNGTELCAGDRAGSGTVGQGRRCQTGILRSGNAFLRPAGHIG